MPQVLCIHRESERDCLKSLDGGQIKPCEPTKMPKENLFWPVDEALMTLLNMQPDLEVVGRAGSLAEGRAVAPDEVDVAVVDVFLPDGNGVELACELRQADPQVSVVILTGGLDPELHALAFEAGADEVCLKAAGIEEILKAIRGVAPDR